MDGTNLAAQLTSFLAPFLPYLLRQGKEVASDLATRFGGDVWNKAKAIWEKISARIPGDSGAAAAAKDLANQPDKEKKQKIFSLQLEDLLEDNPALARELAQLVQDRAVQKAIAQQTVSFYATGGSIISGNSVNQKQ